MRVQSRSLLERVARTIAQPRPSSPEYAASLLARVASAYSAQPVIDDAEGLGDFDAGAAALFEAVVEAAFLIASCDGRFDDGERLAFESVVAEACDHTVPVQQLDALVHDLRKQLAEDGMEKRTRTIGRAIRRRDHQIEVLRIAALIAHISDGVSEHERSVLEQLARGFDLPAGSVNQALLQAEIALQGQAS